MAILELETAIEVSTPVGDGYAIIVETDNHDHWWTVVIWNGAIVTFPQKKIRVKRNYTMTRGISDEEMKQIIK